MIVSMKKLTILCMAATRDAALDAMRDLGVLHLKPIQAPESPDVKRAERALHDCRDALARIRQHADPEPSTETADPVAPGALVAQIEALAEEAREADERAQDLLADIAIHEPFGEFDPAALHRLREQGWPVRLFRIGHLDHVEAPEGVTVFPVSDDGASQFVVAVGHGEFDLGGSELDIPDHSLSALKAAAEDARTEYARVHAEMAALAPHIATLEQHVAHLEEQLAFSQARAGMADSTVVSYLQGYCPADRVADVEAAGAAHGWAVLVEDVADDDPVPTLIRHPRWVRPIKAMYEGLSILPGYREADISAVFLVFFSIFFAILIGDAGYGALFLGLTLWARRRFRKAPAYPFTLFTILSSCTILWGVVTGNYFGIRPEIMPAFLRGLQIGWLTGEHAQDHVMQLCFLIGATHLTVAHVWNAISLAPSLQALAQLGWIAIAWSMYCVAMNMVVGAALPGFFGPMLIVGVILVALFMTPPAKLKSAWIDHAMLPLSVVNCFVDIVSYIRLFAVGLASLSVAQSFNDMAADIGVARVWTIPVFALILLFGHGLNIILCALGILVHGVRLNTLEFSLHKNLEWKGFAYDPFRRQAAGMPQHENDTL